MMRLGTLECQTLLDLLWWVCAHTGRSSFCRSLSASWEEFWWLSLMKRRFNLSGHVFSHRNPINVTWQRKAKRKNDGLSFPLGQHNNTIMLYEFYFFCLFLIQNRCFLILFFLIFTSSISDITFCVSLSLLHLSGSSSENRSLFSA